MTQAQPPAVMQNHYIKRQATLNRLLTQIYCQALYWQLKEFRTLVRYRKVNTHVSNDDE